MSSALMDVNQLPMTLLCCCGCGALLSSDLMLCPVCDLIDPFGKDAREHRMLKLFSFGLFVWFVILCVWYVSFFWG